MVEILKDGFLDDKMQDKIKKVKVKYKDEVDLMYDFNRLTFKIFANYKNIDAIGENLYLLPAFVEISKLYQSAVIMLEYGFTNNFESIVRNMLELSFQMIYVFDDKDKVKNLEKYTYSETMKKLEYIRDNELYNVIPKDIVDKRYEELAILKAELKKEGAKNPPNVKDMCKILGLEKEYSYYQLLSDYTHNDFSVIYDLNVFTEKGVFVNSNGNYTNFKNNSLRLLSTLELTLVKMVDRFVPSLKKEYEKLIQKGIKLYKKQEE